MRALRSVAVCLLMLGLAIAAWAQSDGDLMAEVEAFGNALEKMMVEGDIDSMLSLYTEDAISLPNYGPRLDGTEAMRRHFDEMEAAGMKVLTFESAPSDVWEAGKQVVEIGTYAISLEMQGAPEPIEDKGKYMTVYVRDADGSLKIKAETWNTDINPMAMGAHEPEEGHESHHEEESHEHEGDSSG